MTAEAAAPSSPSVVVTGYGPAAHGALAAAVDEAQAGDRLAPVTVVVPSNYVGLGARRALARRRGIAAVNFVTPYRLAGMLAAAVTAASERQPVSTPVLAARVRSVLRAEPGYFAGVQSHPTTEKSLVSAHRELSEVPDPGLDRLAAASDRAKDVVRIHRAVKEGLADRFHDEQDLIRDAVEALTRGAVPVELGPVIVFLPQRLTAGQARLLNAVAGHTALTVIAGKTGAADADATVKVSLDRLNLASNPAAVFDAAPAPVPDAIFKTAAASSPGGLFGTAGALGPGPSPGIVDGAAEALSSGAPSGAVGGVRALSVSDPDDEVRHAVRAVVDAVRAGASLGRCAIVYGSADPYARLVGDALDSAGIEWYGAAVRTAETSLLGRSLLAMLSLGDNDFARRDVTSWLASGVVRADGRWAPAAAWERAARAAGVTAGDQWASRLDRRADSLETEADELADDEDRAEWAEGRRRRAAEARALAAFVQRLRADLGAGAEAPSWRELSRWCHRLIRDYLGGPLTRSRWPSEEQRHAREVETAADRLGELDGIDDQPSAEAFRQALRTELAPASSRRGRFGVGVLVGPVGLGLGIDLDLAVVCGMAEGVFPPRRRDDALLPDRERSLAGPDLPRRSDPGDDHRALLAVRAGARGKLLLYPRGDLRRSAPLTPSRWLLDAAEAIDGRRPGTDDLGRETGDWLAEVPSFVAGLRRTAFPAHVQEYDMRALLDHHDRRRGRSRSGADPADAAGSNSGPAGWGIDSVRHRVELRRGIELRLGRGSSWLTRFDGNLAAGDLRGAVLPDPAADGSAVSATRLEKWAECPHAYFVRHVLGVDAVEDPEAEYRINALTKGHLVHHVLKRWFDKMVKTGAVVGPGEPWPSDARRQLLEIGAEECDRHEAQGLTGRPLYWRLDRRRLLEDLETFIDRDNTRRAGGGEKAGSKSAQPTSGQGKAGAGSVQATGTGEGAGVRSAQRAAELGFGQPGSDRDAVSIGIGGGRTVRLRGSIDRVDATDDGGLVVIDYKTGSDNNRSYKDLSPENPSSEGRRLQLVLYAEAIRAIEGRAGHPVRADYWFVSAKGGFRTRGYEVTDEVRDRVLETVGAVLDGIAAGLYPSHPDPPQWRPFVPCRFCEPDGLGTRDRHNDWTRKLADPDLRPYLAVAEPGLLEALDDPAAHVGTGAES